MSALKGLVRRVGVRLSGPALRRVPLKSWPAWCGHLLEVGVPATVRPQSPPGPQGPANVTIVLELVSRAVALEGDLAECGVFRGATLLSTGLYLAQNRITKRVFGFDSFAGFDDEISFDIALGGAENETRAVGGFRQTSEQYVKARVRALGLQQQIVVRKGYFRDTLPAEPERRYCFVHLDCDIYSSYQLCLRYFYERVVPGGIILLDEYNDPPWPGCNQAVDEFLALRSEKLQKISRDGYEKYYLVKAAKPQ